MREREHKDCVPVSTVGHAAQMAELATVVRKHRGTNAGMMKAGAGGMSVGDRLDRGGGMRAAFNMKL